MILSEINKCYTIIAADDLEIGALNKIPLYLFGLMY